MKKLFTSICLLCAVLFAMPAYSQDDFSNMYDLHLIYLDQATVSDNGLASKIAQDLRTDDNNKFLYPWADTYSFTTASGKNWNGSLDGYLNLQINNAGWSGLGFYASPTNGFTVDFTKLTPEHIFHIAMKSTGTNTHLFSLIGEKSSQGGKVAIGTAPFDDIVPYTNFQRDGKWHLVEVPVSEFIRAGFVTSAPFTDENFLTLLSGNNPGVTFGMDAIFIYSKTQPSSIGNTTADSNKLSVVVTQNVVSILGADQQPIEIYNTLGQKVKTFDEPLFGKEELNQGVYIAKAGKATAKFIIK